MLQCWQESPEDRPTFKDLHAKLHTILYGNTVCVNRRTESIATFIRLVYTKTGVSITFEVGSWLE